MKALGAILFSLFFLLTTMQEATFLILYKLNEKEITEKYCINKNIKNSCCKGSCHLKTTISNAEREDAKNPFSTTSVKLKEVEIIFQQVQKINLSTPVSADIVFRHAPATVLEEGVTSSLIKPPAVLG